MKKKSNYSKLTEMKRKYNPIKKKKEEKRSKNSTQHK